MEKQIKTKWLIGALIAFLCCAFYAALISFRTMPISEGWYTEYAWQINHGNLPYRDFEYLFFPLYTFIIAGFTKLFGYGIVALRILGIFVFGGIGAALYFLFSKFFDYLSSIVAAVIASLYLQSEVGQMFYDYIRFHDLFAIITAVLLAYYSCRCFSGEELQAGKRVCIVSKVLQVVSPSLLIIVGAVGLIQSLRTTHRIRVFFFLLALCVAAVWLILPAVVGKKTGGKYTVISLPMQAVLCGIFASAECMIKQSNGMLMIAFLAVYFPFCAIVLKKKNFWKGLLGIMTGIVFSFSLLLLYLLFTNSFDSFVTCCFGNAIAAKGGLFATLFQWIPSSWALLWAEREKVAILVILIDLLVGFCISRDMAKNGKRPISIPVLVVCGIVLAFMCWTFVYRTNLAAMASNQYNINIPAIVFFVCTIVFVCFGLYLVFCLAFKKSLNQEFERYLPLFPVLGVVFVQGYGSGMSGGLATSQTVMGFGLVLAFCLHLALSAKRTTIAVFTAVFSLFLGATFVARKSVQAYNWWSLTQGSIWEHTETVDVPLLKGIKVREMDKYFYETVYADIMENTEEGDSIFVFPHCPIVYTMTNRHSITYSKVQWFDVSSVDAVEQDIEALREDPPKMIVYVQLPDGVYEGHESSFHTFQTREMRDFILNTLVPENDYVELHSIDLGNGYAATTYLMEE